MQEHTDFTDALAKAGSRLATATEESSIPRATVIIVNMNGLHHLKECLPTVTQQTYPDYEVVIVDNASTDGSVDYILREYPLVRVIQNASNLGYAGGNNIGFRHSDGAFLAVLNPDTSTEPTWLSELVEAMQSHPRAGLATSKILLMSEPTRINTCGNDVSLTGLASCRGLGAPVTQFTQVEQVAAVSGAAFIIRREVLNTVGGFDESFGFYVEDTDLSWRARLNGYICLYVPTSVVYHQYDLRLTAQKFFYFERNRYLLLIKNLRFRTLCLLLPTLVVSELIIWGYALLRGKDYVVSKLQSYCWLRRHHENILRTRKAVQATRKISDRTLLALCAPRLAFEQAVDGAIGRIAQVIFTPLLAILHKITLSLIRW